MKKTPDEMSQDSSYVQPTESSAGWSRRSLITKGTAAGIAATAGIAAFQLAGANVEVAQAHNSSKCLDSVHTIITVARTAERLAVTFVSNGIKHAAQLGLSGATLENVRAVAIEEQIHEYYLRDQGAGVLASEFSFPYGPKTFEDLPTFLKTLAEIGGVFDTAYLAATKEFAQLGRPDLAQVAAQIAWVEGEHLALGRQIGINAGLIAPPANNWVFAPVLVPSVGALPALAKKEGYLSPRKGNRYAYNPISTEDPGIIYRHPYAVPCE